MTTSTAILNPSISDEEVLAMVAPEFRAYHVRETAIIRARNAAEDAALSAAEAEWQRDPVAAEAKRSALAEAEAASFEDDCVKALDEWLANV